MHRGRDALCYPAHCLHCGLCYESCPVEAIERLGNVRALRIWGRQPRS
ncbi:4Fe-4S binding protein [Selenomonas noxia]|nr:4Fe-4S binding protein [Selenomonas noxia]